MEKDEFDGFKLSWEEAYNNRLYDIVKLEEEKKQLENRIANLEANIKIYREANEAFNKKINEERANLNKATLKELLGEIGERIESHGLLYGDY